MKRFARPRASSAHRPFILVAAVASAWSPFATAQEKSMEPVVVTATRTAQAARDVLPDTEVITAEEIARSGETSLAELLQRRRGVEIVRNGGPGTQTSVFLRGADNNKNVVLIDGVRAGSVSSGGASWAAIPLSQIDRIEIVYGPLSTLYGSDAVGGVIQIFTKKGDGAPHPTVSASYGSYQTKSLEAGVSGSANTFRYAISAGHESSNGFSATRPTSTSYNLDDDGYTRDSVSGNFSLDLAKGHELGVNFFHSKLDAQVDLFGSAATFDARSVTRLESYALYSKNRFLPNWNSTVTVARSKDKLDSISSTGTTYFNTTQDQFSWQNDLAVGSDVLQVLAERREEKLNSTTAYPVTERTTDSLAASYLLKRGPHLATSAVRYDDISGYGSKVTGNLGYGYQFASAWRANANIGTSFRAPTFNELYFPGFGLSSNKPEKGRNTDIGLYYDNGTSRFSAVYYHNELSDLIVTVRPCPDPAFTSGSCAYNVNEATLSGLTLNGETRFGNITLRGSLDLQDPHDDTANKQLARRARRHGSLAAEYNAGALHTGVETVFSSKRYDDAANRTVLAGYGLLNLYASYDVARNWTVFGRWNNVLDKDYELAKNFTTPGSSVFVGVRYGFQ